jgi:NitT/TauT family transport system permease protein
LVCAAKAAASADFGAFGTMFAAKACAAQSRQYTVVRHPGPIWVSVGLKVMTSVTQGEPVQMNERNSAGPTGAVAGAISLTGDASLVQRFGQWLSRRRWRLGSIVGGLLFWELCARYFANPLFLAAPSHIAVAVVKLWESRLPNDIALSASEFLIGYLLATLGGIGLGLVMATSVRAKDALEPWMTGLYATPTIALAPLFILWMGIGIWSKVAVVFILVIFPVVLNTEAGLRTTSSQLIETARSFGASRSQIFWKVSLPSALPFIFAGLKIGIGRGLIGVVVAELFGSRAGLGQLISQSAETFNMPELFAGVIILAIAGITITSAFATFERRVVHWH